MAKIKRKPEEFLWYIENLKTGTEYGVLVLYYYYPPYPGVMNPPDRAQPPEPAEVELVGVVHHSGGSSEVEWEQDRDLITRAILDEESDEYEKVVQAIFDHIAGEAERLAESETEYEAYIDAAIAQSYDETH